MFSCDWRALGLLAAVVAMPTFVVADTIRGGFDSSTLARNDDGSTELVSVGFELDFFGVTSSQVYVNNNGNITLDQALSTYTPFDLNATSQQIIAPFFADIDTRSAGSEVTYGTGTVDGRAAFGVNWIDVGYFSNQTDPNQLNDIQLVLIDRSDLGVGNFDFEFNFGDILWETGNIGGTGGFGGPSARSGYSNGTGDAGTFFEIEGSAVNGAFLNGGANELISGSNIGVDGRYLFGARNGTVVVPPVVTPTPTPTPTPSPVPLPASAVLLGFGLLGLGAAGRRRKAS